MNEWLYVEQEPIVAIYERGLSARVWDANGVLISSLQEALRKRRTNN